MDDWDCVRLDSEARHDGVCGMVPRTERGSSFKEMVKLDYLYVSGWSLWGDLRLIARTIPAVFGGRQAY